MTLEIKPPSNFRHAGEISGRFDRFDPRKVPFEPSEVFIDLRDCNFVQPSAAMWCAVYSSLARKRGVHSELLVPLGNFGVATYLKSLGLFDVLKNQDVQVDDNGVPALAAPKTILPITQFKTVSEATAVTNRAFDALQSSGLGAANLTTVVTELFGELTMNAAQHSESEVGAFACVQFLERHPRFICCVADGGIGIREHLSRNQKHRSRVNYDWDALDLAVRERVSGTGDPNRGIGLYGVSEDVRHPNRSLLLHSGLGALEITEQLEMSARRTRLFPGTLAFLSIPS